MISIHFLSTIFVTSQYFNIGVSFASTPQSDVLNHNRKGSNMAQFEAATSVLKTKSIATTFNFWHFLIFEFQILMHHPFTQSSLHFRIMQNTIMHTL